MKTIEDFEIIDGIAILKDVAYAEEANVVDEFLKNNKDVKFVSVLTKNGCHFELKNRKFVFSKEGKFLNPYFIEDRILINEGKEEVKKNNLEPLFNVSIYELDQKIFYLEEKMDKLNSLLKDIGNLLFSYFDFK